ncbi:hypothetical protein BDV96DRAFT_279179 [Lophiotrema nucula]|uniref:Uncharacterized protein n=1 Tax=Lophiotrema nucula TaxID=690887 RepID=A0A6A5ZNQ9_9PLEO|nr:hypothetical protein BDV96DRAFT_279179 [Lophiotrema nucula]
MRETDALSIGRSPTIVASLWICRTGAAIMTTCCEDWKYAPVCSRPYLRRYCIRPYCPGMEGEVTISLFPAKACSVPPDDGIPP